LLSHSARFLSLAAQQPNPPLLRRPSFLSPSLLSRSLPAGPRWSAPPPTSSAAAGRSPLSPLLPANLRAIKGQLKPGFTSPLPLLSSVSPQSSAPLIALRQPAAAMAINGQLAPGRCSLPSSPYKTRDGAPAPSFPHQLEPRTSPPSHAAALISSSCHHCRR
jgi:hypothetical protein